jgi:hypothetical protein
LGLGLKKACAQSLKIFLPAIHRNSPPRKTFAISRMSLCIQILFCILFIAAFVASDKHNYDISGTGHCKERGKIGLNWHFLSKCIPFAEQFSATILVPSNIIPWLMPLCNFGIAIVLYYSKRTKSWAKHCHGRINNSE